jgi:hypothetical protein
MSAISLESALRTSKVNTGYADKIQSDRFLNPSNMVCPVWSGFDTAGRSVPVNSFYTKREGCNSAQDRVSVENDQRPQYLEYVTLNSGGISGSIYNKTVPTGSDVARGDVNRINENTGNFGMQFSADVRSTSGYNNYERHAQNMQMRQAQAASAGGSDMRGYAGI